MENQILGSIIEASGMVLSAIISIAGVFYIMKHRKKVQGLADQVIAYHSYEDNLVRELYQNEKSSEGSDGQIRHYKRQLRDAHSSDIRPSMTANQARALRDSFF